MTPEPGRPQTRVYNAAFYVLLLLFELFLLTLPLFPTGDGPVHLYLASVFWQVATHRSPLYEHFYAVRHLLQPYSFGYGWLIALEHFAIPADLAEKLFAGLIWATLAFSFRTLTRTLHPGAPAAALLVFPLLLSWPLSAGFFNFTFAVGLLLLALALYEQLQQPAKARKAMAGLLLTLLLLVLAHPVPLLMLVCLIGLDLLQQKAAGRRIGDSRQIAALTLCCLAFVIPVLIADKTAVAGSLHEFWPDIHRLPSMLFGTYVCWFFVNSSPGWLYQLLIVAVVPGAVFLKLYSGLFHRLRTGTTDASDRLSVGSFLFLVGTLVLPDTMNGSQYFASRMWYPLWLVIAACLDTRTMNPRGKKAVAIYATGLALLCLGFGMLYLRPVARQQAELEQAPLPPGKRGLFFQPENAGTTGATHSWWPLTYWDGVRAFAAHDDVLLNTPWLQLTILPVKENGRAGLMRDLTPENDSESPNTMLLHLDQHPERREEVFAQADFLLVADPGSAVANPLGVAARLLGPLGNQWRCVRHDFYAVCRR